MIKSVTLKTNATISNTSLKKMKKEIRFVHGRKRTIYSYQLYKSIKMPIVKFVKETGALIVEIPSFEAFYGAFTVSDLASEFLYLDLRDAIEEELKFILFPSQEKWAIESITLYYDFEVGANLHDYLNVLRQTSITNRRFKQCLASYERVEWRYSNKYVVFYGLQDERDREIENDQTIYADEVLRFECNVNKEELAAKIGVPTLNNYPNNEDLKLILAEYLLLFRKLDRRVTNEAELFKLIEEVTNCEEKANTIIGYLRRKQLGLDSSLSTDTKNEYLNVFNQLNFPAAISSKSLSPLIID
jgi:hypothetical protein